MLDGNLKKFLSNQKIAKPEQFCPTVNVQPSGTSSNSDVDIDKIIDRLMDGDTSDLETLKNVCTYFCIDRSDNGYTISFTYQGKSYHLVYTNANAYNSSGVSDNKTPLSEYLQKMAEIKQSTLNNYSVSDNTSDNNQKTTPIDYSNEFDYSGISGLDNSVKDNSNNNLLASMSQIKEQLQQYIKSQMEARGLKYDESFVNKKLNQIITQIADIAINQSNTSNGAYEAYSTEALISNYKLDTVNDCINTLIDFVKKSFEAQDIKLQDDPLYFKTAMLIKDMFNPDKEIISQTQNKVLEETADFFLTDDEIKLKEALRAARHTNICAHADTKENTLDYLRVYADYMKNVLKQNYPNLTDERISTIIENSKQTTESVMKPEPDGSYDLGDILRFFAGFCNKKARLGA